MNSRAGDGLSKKRETGRKSYPEAGEFGEGDLRKKKLAGEGDSWSWIFREDSWRRA